ncbi:MAG: hypothetical protein RLZZ200_2576, partial [Pseudomonadota bacterium]
MSLILWLFAVAGIVAVWRVGPARAFLLFY